MTTPSTSTSLSSLDRQRQHLESTIRDLQTSLYNWRLWEAEYDGLKLALQEARGRDGAVDEVEDMLRVALEYTSSLSSVSGEKTVLSEKEVRDIVSGGTGTGTRTKDQVISLLDRRIDYVRENVRVLEKRVADAERKLENWLGAIAVEDEEGNGEGEGGGKGKGPLLPVTEIVEELDEEGNVVRGETMRAGESAAELLDMLKKAGVEGLDGDGRKKEIENKTAEQAPAASAPAPGDGKELKDTSSSPGQSVPSENAPSVSNVAVKASSTNGTIPHDNKDDDDEDDSIVMEVDESPEDAALRREMIQYGLQEVGAVVAELELDEDGSEFSLSDDDYDYDDEEDEEEDEYGRSTRRMIDEDYHRQMRELEAKLNARSIQNIGPDASVLPEEVQRELNGELKKVSLEEQNDTKPEKRTGKPKKRVAFATELDIAPDPALAPPQVQTKKQDKVVTSPEVAPIQEQIVERTERDRTTASETKQPKKVSRFRSARQAKESTPAATPAPPTMPQPNLPRVQPTHPSPQNITLFPAKPAEPKPFSQPIVYPDEPAATPAVKPAPNKILQDTLIERPMGSNPNSSPAAPEHDPDDFDEAIHQREIASEFYRLRNRKIQLEGGFLRDDEPEIVPIDEDEDANEEPSGGRKMSRFMAARLRQQQ